LKTQIKNSSIGNPLQKQSLFYVDPNNLNLYENVKK